MSFEHLRITRQFLNALDDAGITTPTEIQEKAIPPIRGGQDVIGIAQTGTGKTAAFALPLLGALKFASGNPPRALVLVPTKELVMQVATHFKMLSKYTDLRIVALYGGVGYKKQAEEVEAGCDIIVATPGRFMEIYLKGYIPAKKIKHLVLDEADRMMDMGFMPQLRQIFEVIPSKRQNLLFSATFPPRVERLSEEFLLWPTRIEVTPESTPVETVEQCYYSVPNFRSKLNLLEHLLRNREDMRRVIVFVRTKEYAENIGKYLQRIEIGEVRVIHSNKGQNSRLNAMADFHGGEVRVLVSTDVAARGIDIPEVSHVINYSVPRDYLDYVHRIGRTGRALRTGNALTFVDRAESYHLKKIEGIIRMEVPEISIPEAVEILETPKHEFKEQAREIDHQRRREDPDYKGAFHDRKRKPGSGRKSGSSSGKRRPRR